MKRTEIAKLFRCEKKPEGEVTVCGWIKTIRDSKTIGFVEINDGSGFKNLQVIIETDKLPNFTEIVKQNVGAAVQFTGEIILTPEMKQPFELHAVKAEVLGESTADYPLQKKRHSLEFLRTIAHLRPRTNTFNALYRVRSIAAFALHSFFNENGFVYSHTPIITGSDCEGAGEMFQITTLDMQNPPKTDGGEIDYSQDFFGKQTGLTVSGQLQVETMAQAFGKVYTFGPTFRAEKSFTTRHAAEFWMVEPELSFADLIDDMDCAEAMMKFVCKYVLEHCPDEMEFFNSFIDKDVLNRLGVLINEPFARVSYTDAVEILKEHNAEFDYKVEWGCDLQTEHERYLTEVVYKKPVFVTDYPKDIKAFYMRLNDDGKTVAAADLLVTGVGEIIGGSQREERLDLLKSRIAEMGLDEADYWWYLDLRKYGTSKHAGFGLGFDRLIMYMTGVSNIRDVAPFSRTTGSLEF